MLTELLLFLIAILIIGVVAWVLTLLINRFVPIDAVIRQILVGIIWVAAVIAIIYRAIPLMQSIAI